MNYSRETTGEEGMRLLEGIKAAHPELPVILITAWGSIELAVRGMKAGAADFITKPWSNEQVLQSVRTALGLAASEVSRGEGEAPGRAELDKRYDIRGIIGENRRLLDALDLACRALFDPGETVLVVEPSYVAYTPCAELSGARVVSVPTSEDDEFVVMRGQLAPFASGAKALVLSYPSNPTGAVVSREEMLNIAHVAQAHDLLVLSDEIYDRLVYGVEHVCVASLPGMWKLRKSGFLSH